MSKLKKTDNDDTPNEVMAEHEDGLVDIEIRLPNGDIVEKGMTYEEVCYWVSLGMYLTHGFNAITMAYAADQMDEASTIDIDPEKEQAVN